MYKVITHSSYHYNRIPFYTTNLQLFHNFAKWVSRRVGFIANGNELKVKESPVDFSIAKRRTIKIRHALV